MNTQLEQAAKQALKFVVGIHPAFICEAMNHTKAQRHSTLDSCPHIETQRQVAEALRAALEQPAQDESTSDTSQNRVDETAKQRHEPVAWMNKHGACMSAVFKDVDASAGEYTTPLYTRPQAREWVKLTDKELSEVYNQADWDTVNGWEYERAIEAKLKEKNT